MRTSGGGRDGMMTAIPLIMLVLFVITMSGGAGSSLAWVEGVLRGFVEGMVRFMS